MTKPTTTPTADDDLIIRGAKQIGMEFDPPMSPSQAFYHLEKGNIPARKLGRIWVTTRRHLRAAATVVAAE